MVVLVPEPVITPGLIVQLPAGRPVNNTLPVETEQDGWVTVLAMGAAGVPAFGIITILAEGKEVHPAAFVTV